MWLLVLFDLPVNDKTQRRNYDRFRKKLLSRGLTALQFSVYYRYCASRAFAGTILNQIQTGLPPEGKVRFLLLSQQTFSQMQVFENQKPIPCEEPPEPFVLF